MCGIAGVFNIRGEPVKSLGRKLDVMGELLSHRGPDDAGIWSHERDAIGFSHRRLSIIDTSDSGHQPMIDAKGNVVVHNGEIYNYLELRKELSPGWPFRSSSDTETILAAYEKYGPGCVDHFRGMFAFALWDGDKLFCARDRFGIKPFYYFQSGDLFYFASEVKALLPFLPEIKTDDSAFSEYLAFQFPLGEKTLFKGVYTLLPGHTLIIKNGSMRIQRYWDVTYDIDWTRKDTYFQDRLKELLSDSMDLHLRSDVEIGSYLSGGLDSSLMAILAKGHGKHAFHGKFTDYPGYDESHYARIAADASGHALHEVTITADDFVENIQNVIYHLDYPIAGPGSFPQYMVSEKAAGMVKVVLGGQGGDEIFGGYARYLIAYFEQCFKAAVEGTYEQGNFVVTAESIIPNLRVLQEYRPLIKRFMSSGLFDPLDKRYFWLIDRSGDMGDEIVWDELDMDAVYNRFTDIFNSERNVRKESYFDSMTHFDFKTMLPALLHVEDRMSMAHGLESRVPFLDHPLIELVAQTPADIKFKDGRMKHLLKETFNDMLPSEIVNRRDKMGFPVPVSEWFAGDLRDYVGDIFHSRRAGERQFINRDAVLKTLDGQEKFTRKIWGLLCLELWNQTFHDQASKYAAMAN